MKTYFSLTCGGWGPRGPRTPTPHPTLLSVNVGYQNIKKLLPLRKYKIPGDSREKVPHSPQEKEGSNKSSGCLQYNLCHQTSELRRATCALQGHKEGNSCAPSRLDAAPRSWANPPRVFSVFVCRTRLRYIVLLWTRLRPASEEFCVQFLRAFAKPLEFARTLPRRGAFGERTEKLWMQ